MDPAIPLRYNHHSLGRSQPICVGLPSSPTGVRHFNLNSSPGKRTVEKPASTQFRGETEKCQNILDPVQRKRI